MNTIPNNQSDAQKTESRKSDPFHSTVPITFNMHANTTSDWCYGTERVWLARLQKTWPVFSNFEHFNFVSTIVLHDCGDYEL